MFQGSASKKVVGRAWWEIGFSINWYTRPAGFSFLLSENGLLNSAKSKKSVRAFITGDKMPVK